MDQGDFELKRSGCDETSSVEFEPSDDLRRAYGRAIGGLFALLGWFPKGSDLWETVHSVLVSEARFQRGREPVAAPLAASCGSFVPAVADCLAVRLMIRPRRADEFLRILATELAAYVGSGGRVEGSWGSVEAVDGGLAYRLTAKEAIVFERSTRRTIDLAL
jgi:hypothetical protein